MQCENDKEQLTLYMNNQMTDAERVAFENHLATCAECKEELHASQKVWDLMGEIPVPEPARDMQLRFNAMLDVYKAQTEDLQSAMPSILQRLKQLFTLQPGFAVAYSMALIIIGVGAGYLVNSKSNVGGITNASGNVSSANTSIDSLKTQVHEMKEMVMLALLQNPSASERIRGVSYTSEIKGVNKNIVEALLTTLSNDPNINVRLMTLDALTHFANDPAVREGLVQSIIEQDSPLVQSALADAMLKLQEKRSVQPFRKLLQQKDLNIMVRSKIEETITRLI